MTHPNNRHQLNREVITAVNAICRLKRYASLGFAFLEAFDQVDLGELRQRAISFGLWTQPLWMTIASLILVRLRTELEPLASKTATKRIRFSARSSRRDQ